MKKIFSLFVVIFVIFILAQLSGCARIQKVVDAGAEANDAALLSAEFVICRGASVGAVRRHYGTKEMAAVWREFCQNADGDNFTPERQQP